MSVNAPSPRVGRHVSATSCWLASRPQRGGEWDEQQEAGMRPYWHRGQLRIQFAACVLFSSAGWLMKDFFFVFNNGGNALTAQCLAKCCLTDSRARFNVYKRKHYSKSNIMFMLNKVSFLYIFKHAPHYVPFCFPEPPRCKFSAKV